MRSYSFVFVQNLIILLFLVLTCTAFLQGEPTVLPLAGVVFWLALLGLLGNLNDKTSLDKNYRMIHLLNWSTTLVSAVIPSAIGGYLVGGWLIGFLSGGLIWLATLIIYRYAANFMKLKQNKKDKDRI